ncbi:MAG: hypothetical protein Q9227_006058 [Pyrenula ochraceoflavens]
MTKKKGKQQLKTGTKTSGSGKPRFGAVERILHRFYEPLVLLHTLNPTRGDQIPRDANKNDNNGDLKTLRRSFLDDLSYFCDYEKGGETVTAIALESQPQGNVFWVASNANAKSKMLNFLREVMCDLQRFTNAPNLNEGGAQLVNSLARKAIKFGQQRIKKYFSLLLQKQTLPRCLKFLEQNHSYENVELAAWLKGLVGRREKLLELCDFCYKARKSSFMRRLDSLARESAHNNSTDSISAKFRDVHHNIGRLGYHFHAAGTLVEAAERMPQIFETYEIKPCPPPLSEFAIPAADAKTTFNSMLVRMLPSDAAEQVQEYQEQLQKFDTNHDLYKRFMKSYNDKYFKPRVHCELVVLEHFYTKSLKFYDSDRYIGCSKPSCYCCALYIRYHPGDFERPACHQKLYLNWRPPDAAYKPDGKGSVRHRNILNDIIAHVRRDVLQQISDRGNWARWHPDSVTGISSGTVTSKARPGIDQSSHLGDQREDVGSVDAESAAAMMSQASRASSEELDGESQWRMSAMMEDLPPLDSSSDAEVAKSSDLVTTTEGLNNTEPEGGISPWDSDSDSESGVVLYQRL